MTWFRTRLVRFLVLLTFVVQLAVAAGHFHTALDHTARHTVALDGHGHNDGSSQDPVRHGGGETCVVCNLVRIATAGAPLASGLTVVVPAEAGGADESSLERISVAWTRVYAYDARGPPAA